MSGWRWDGEFRRKFLRGGTYRDNCQEQKGIDVGIWVNTLAPPPSFFPFLPDSGGWLVHAWSVRIRKLSIFTRPRCQNGLLFLLSMLAKTWSRILADVGRSDLIILCNGYEIPRSLCTSCCLVPNKFWQNFSSHRDEIKRVFSLWVLREIRRDPPVRSSGKQ